ncbi:neprilysin-11-like [Paramacrobiotus metropolitanus]|uniref:neprilysin-11-like n=1 Tax=Paramacrobiotus metropolitanus TaxID=2943436 RepID=UPI002445A9C0|nr:neprilysin-11-like [Paramacrobiotus metropolitanus]
MLKFIVRFYVSVGLLAMKWPSCISRTASYSVDIQANNAHPSHSSSPDKDAAACQIPDYKEIAAKFLSRIDTSVNPCNDFYQFSCGKWIKAQEDEASDALKLNRTRAILTKLLKGDVKPAGPVFEAEKKMKDLYKQCINIVEIEKLRGTPIIKILNDFNGGWPMITPGWDASKFNVFDVLIENLFFGNDCFFSVKIAWDVEQPNINRVILDTMTPFVATELLLDDDVAGILAQSYFNGITNATKLLLRDNKQLQSVTKLWPDISDIAEMELFLGKETLTAVEKSSDTIYLNKFTLKAFKNHYKFKSAILRNITKYLRAYFAVANRSAAITDDTIVIVPTLRYWNKLDDKLVELENQGAEGRRRMANYIGFKLIFSVLPYLSKDYRDIVEDWSINIEDKCMDVVKINMPLALSTLCVRDIVPKDLKKKIS